MNNRFVADVQASFQDVYTDTKESKRVPKLSKKEEKEIKRQLQYTCISREKRKGLLPEHDEEILPTKRTNAFPSICSIHAMIDLHYLPQAVDRLGEEYSNI